MDYRTKLSELNRSDLNNVAKKLKIRNYSQGTKAELVELIVSARSPKQIKKVVSPSLWNRYHNHVYGMVGGIVGIAGLVLTIYLTPTTKPSQGLQDTRNIPEAAAPLVQKSNGNTSDTPEATPTANLAPPPSPTPTAKYSASPKPRARESASIHLERARSLYGQGQYEAALAACDRALSLEPKNIEAINLKNLITEHVNRLKQ